MNKIGLIVILIIVLILTSISIYIFVSKEKQPYNENNNNINTNTNPNENNNEEESLNNNDIFGMYYDKANELLKNMNIDEKISQTLLVRYPDNAKDILEKYQFGGYVFFEKDFTNKTKQEVQNMINELQEVSEIPILTAVDEEGGIVNRISTNPNLVETPFLSSQQLYKQGGFDLIKKDTINKSKILSDLGINLNLAPVVDVSTNPNDYMYNRTIGQDTTITSTYAKTVIEASKNTRVSYTLKHFPGYGNNVDTHTNSSLDNRALEDIKTNDLPPFEAGIKAKAEAVLISHNIVNSIDKNNPASLSESVHKLLTDDLDFNGIIITDAIDMGAITNIENVSSKALKAGNHLIITTNYLESINDIKNAINNNEISIEELDKVVIKILAWKYYKGLL